MSQPVAMSTAGIIKIAKLRYEVFGENLDAEVAQVLVGGEYERPTVIARQVLEKGPDDTVGHLFGGASGAPATVYAAGATILDLTLGANRVDQNVRVLLGTGDDPQAMMVITGIRIELQHNDSNVNVVQNFLNGTAIRYSGPDTPTVYIPTYECGGTFLPVNAPCEGATAALQSAARRLAITKWLDNPIAVDFNRDTLALEAVAGGWTVGGTAANGIDIHFYGAIWTSALGKIHNDGCRPSFETRLRKTRVRRGMTLQHATVIGRR